MEDKQKYDISDKEALESRKQEMESLLPGLMQKFVLPNSKKTVDIYSPEPKMCKI